MTTPYESLARQVRRMWREALMQCLAERRVYKIVTY